MNPKTGNLYPQEIICKDKNVERVWILEMKHKMMMYALITPWGNESLLVCLFYWDRELHLNLLPDAIPLSMKKWAVALDGTAGKRLPAPQCSCRGLGAAQRGSAHPSAAGGCGLIPIISHWRSRRASWNKEVWRFPKCYLLLVTPQQRSCAHLTLPGAVESLLPVAAGDLSWSRMMTMGAETLPPPPPPPRRHYCIVHPQSTPLSLLLRPQRGSPVPPLMAGQQSICSPEASLARAALPGARLPDCRGPPAVYSSLLRVFPPAAVQGAAQGWRLQRSGPRCPPARPPFPQRRPLPSQAAPRPFPPRTSRPPLVTSLARSPPSLLPAKSRASSPPRRRCSRDSQRAGGRARGGGGRGGAAPRQPAAPALPDRRAAGAAAAAGMSLRSARRWWRRRWRRRRPGSPWLPPAMAGSAPRGPESCRSRRWGEAAAMRKGRSRGDKAAPPPPPRREPGRAVAASAAERRATLLGGGGRKDPEDARAAGAPCREALERVKPGRGAGGGGRPVPVAAVGMETRAPRGGGRRRAGAPGGAAFRARPGCVCRSRGSGVRLARTGGLPRLRCAGGGGAVSVLGVAGGGGFGERRGAALGGRGRPRAGGGGAASCEHPPAWRGHPQVDGPRRGRGGCGGVSGFWRRGAERAVGSRRGGRSPACTAVKKRGRMQWNLVRVLCLLVVIITECFLLVTFCRSLLIVTLVMMHFPAFLRS